MNREQFLNGLVRPRKPGMTKHTKLELEEEYQKKVKERTKALSDVFAKEIQHELRKEA